MANIEGWIQELPPFSVVIMRGIPGSGKTSTAVRIGEESFLVWDICSADHHFVDPNTGAYLFIPNELPHAHQECFRHFTEALNRNDELVIVDNTNIQLAHYLQYEQAAQVHEYNFFVVEIVQRNAAEVQLCFHRNIHGVPQATINRMHVSLIRQPDNRAFLVNMH